MPDNDAPPPSTEPVPSRPEEHPSRMRRWGRWLVRLPGTMWRNAKYTWREHKLLFIVLGFIFVFAIAYFWKDIVVKVRSGEAAVLYRLFQGGTVTDRGPYGEGIHFVAPWNTMTIYNVRVQQVADEFTVLSADGLEIKVGVSIRCRPRYDDLGKLHKEIGPDYIEKVVKPEIQAEFRFVLGQYKPDEIYQSQGFIVQTVVQGALGEIGERHILLDDLLLKSVTLPRPVAESIESKLRAQQLALEYKYRIESEQQEAERKKIEAQGIRSFQEMVTGEGKGISEQFLRFKGIEATLELAKSPNAKIVIIGGGDDRLPLILDGGTRSESGLPVAPAPGTNGTTRSATPSSSRTATPPPRN